MYFGVVSDLVFVLVTLATAVYLYFKYKYTYWTSRGVRSLPPKFPLGNLERNVDTKDLVHNFYKEKGQEPFVAGYFFNRPVVIATDLDLIKNVLIKDFHNFSDRELFYNERDDPLSANLLTLEPVKWRTLRSKLSPTFTSGKMKFMYSTIVEVAEQLNETLCNNLEKTNEIEFKDLLARFTTDVIGTCAFGIECNSLKDPKAEFRVYGSEVFNNPVDGPISRVFKMQFPNLAKKLRMRVVRKDISDFFMGVVRETVKLREENNIRRNDFMDLLIDLKNNEAVDENGFKLGHLTIEEIAAQAFLFFLAGFETSSTTISLSLYELAMNIDIQERARKEINEILEKYHGKLTYEAMMEMTYVDNIISETLRKYPPLAALIRATQNDYSIPNSQYVIPKGVPIIIPVYSIHHDPEIYSNPEIFNPERFTYDGMKDRHSMAFLAFGDGPRNCIGLRFGKMQSRIGLITLIKNYRFSIGDKTQVPIKFSIMTPVLSPEGGLWLNVEKI